MCMPLVESSDSLSSVTDDEAGLLSRLEPCSVPDCRSKLTLKWVFVFCIFPIWGRCIDFSISTFSGLVLLISFLFLHVFSYNITPPQFRSSYLSMSTYFHVLITTSSSVFLFTFPNHLSPASLIFSLMFTSRSHLPLLIFLHY